MVARRGSGDATPALLGIERREAVDDTSGFERAGVLEQLGLEYEARREVGPVEERRPPHAPADRLGCPDDVRARDRIAAHVGDPRPGCQRRGVASAAPLTPIARFRAEGRG